MRLRPSDRLPLAAALMLLLGLVVAGYGRTLDGEFQYDDLDAVETHPAVIAGGALELDRLAAAWVGGGRPATELTLAWNHAAGGLVPWNFHLTNLGIHLCGVLLVWAFTRLVLRLAGASRREWTALLVAALFALHPLQTEAVSYVSQRSESLASALHVATLLLVITAERSRSPLRAALRWAGALLAFGVALGAKQIAVTMPAAWLVLTAVVPAPERRSELLPWRNRLAALVPFAAVAALFGSRVLVGLHGSGDAGFSVEGVPPWTYLLTELRAHVLYLRLLLWPVGQNVDWDFPLSRSLSEPAVWASGLLVAGLVAGAVGLVAWARRSSGDDAAAARVAGFGVLWFFLVLSPSSSVVPLADPVAEHRVYLASWGVFAAVVVGLERLLARAPARLRAPVGAVVGIVICGSALAALHARNAVWETRRALWEDAVVKSPGKARAWFNLAHAALREGSLEESLLLGRMALQLSSGNPGLELQIAANLGAAELLLGRYDRAEATLRGALRTDRTHPDVLANLAAALLAQDRPAEAEGFARRAVELEPANAAAWSALGEVALRQGDGVVAVDRFGRAAALEPHLELRRYDLGRALAAVGRSTEACRAWEEVRAGGDAALRRAVTIARASAGCEGRVPRALTGTRPGPRRRAGGSGCSRRRRTARGRRAPTASSSRARPSRP